jgi:hypothetical protein
MVSGEGPRVVGSSPPRSSLSLVVGACFLLFRQSGGSRRRGAAAGQCRARAGRRGGCDGHAVVCCALAAQEASGKRSHASILTDVLDSHGDVVPKELSVPLCCLLLCGCT